MERVKRIKLRQQLFGGTKLIERENECAQHPRIGGAQILRLVLQRRLELELARRVRAIEKKHQFRLSPTLLCAVFECWKTRNEGFLRLKHDYYCGFS